MKTYSPEKWAIACQGIWKGQAPASISGVGLDSRRLQAGELFIAIRSEQRDGHDFLAAAFAQGAAAAIVERGRALPGYPCLEVEDTRRALTALGHAQRRDFRGKVIGVTGSCGKTSTKEMLRLLLGDRVWATPGNLNNDLGLPISLLSLNNDEHDFGVFELGINHTGEMQALTEVLEPDYAVVTNVAAAHLAGIGSLQDVAREKSVLLTRNRNAAGCYFPAECLLYPEYRSLAGQVIAKRGEPCSVGDSRIREYTSTIKDNGTVIGLAGVDQEFWLNSTGKGMTSNAVLALTLALDVGVAADVAAQRLSRWSGAAMRAEWKEWRGFPVFVDCYNSNPHSLEEAGQIFDQRTAQAGPRLWVLGGMGELGEQSAYWHEQVALRLPVKAGDTVLAIGAEAADFQKGLKNIADGQGKWIHCLNTEEGLTVVREFEGPLFFKGSRRFALETLLLEELRDLAAGTRQQAPHIGIRG